MYQGIVDLETENFLVADLVRNSSQVPINADALPTYRVVGPDGNIVTSGTMEFLDTGSITNATNASPIVVTSAAHGLTTGTRVTISGVGGNPGANGTFVVTVVSPDTFSLNGSSGGGAYTSGGTWNVTGLYAAYIDVTAAGGFEAGSVYLVLITGVVSSANYGEIHSFIAA